MTGQVNHQLTLQELQSKQHQVHVSLHQQQLTHNLHTNTKVSASAGSNAYAAFATTQRRTAKL